MDKVSFLQPDLRRIVVRKCRGYVVVDDDFGSIVVANVTCVNLLAILCETTTLLHCYSSLAHTLRQRWSDW